MHVDKLTLLLGGNLSFGLDVGEQPLVGFRGDVLADEGGRHQDDLDAGLLRRIDHRGDVLLVLRQILLVGGQRFSVGIPEVLPHVVDADGDDHISRLVLHHVLVEPRHEVLGPLTAHARVDHLGKFHAGILLGQHGVDDADKSGIPVAAFARDRIADGDNLLAALELELLGGTNPMISILERGDSYQPLVELMGGEMIEMSLDSDQTINPWDLPRGEDRPSNDQISFLKNLTRHMLGENTPPDLDIDLLDSVLLEAIASTYKRCSAKTSNPIPLFGDLAAELAHWQDRDRNQKINAMAQLASTKLRAWVDEGPYARLFDRPTTVQLNNPWLYFNVEKLKDDPRLERAMSLLIAHTATYRASGVTGQPSIVLLDECWALLESPILASVVVQLFRTARKRNASVWGISQTPEDFVGTPDRPNEHGAGIVKNATTKIIGKQPGDMTALREHVHLNETALNQIKTFAHPKKGVSAEFLIAIGEKAESTHAIRIVPSAVDYWITTTYARERAFRKWWLRQHRQLPLIQAYEELAAEYPRGLAELAPLPVELSGEMREAMSQ